jgi:hypothetical protein
VSIAVRGIGWCSTALMIPVHEPLPGSLHDRYGVIDASTAHVKTLVKASFSSRAW